MSFQGFDHYIQREIFMKLRANDIARYADLNIKTIESSQFMYHLKELIKRGLVEKIDKGRYQLTPRGITLSQNFSGGARDLRLAPLTYTLIFARSTKGQWLIWKRAQQPFYGMYACVSGKVHMNETLTEAAQREWQEMIGLPVPDMTYRGQVSVLLQNDGSVVTHIAGSVWFVDGLTEEWSTYQTDKGPLGWYDWKTLPYKEFIPGWRELVEALQQNSQPFLLDLKLPL